MLKRLCLHTHSKDICIASIQRKAEMLEMMMGSANVWDSTPPVGLGVRVITASTRKDSGRRCV
eukprot:3325807-Amphidinium_carterae.1